MSINWWIKEQKLVHPYSRILFGHEKGWKVQSWEIQTKPESGNSMWRELWNQVLWEVTGESASVGTLNGPGVLTGWERKKDVTGTEVPGFCLDMTEVVLTHHTNHAQTMAQQRWHTQVFSRGYLCRFHPILSCLWLWTGHWCALSLYLVMCITKRLHICLPWWLVLEG